MKTLLFVSALAVLSISSLSGQNAAGTLKVFSEEPVMVYVDEVHYPEYGDISLVPGTHYLKALNKDEVKVYSEIISIKAGQVTSILIEAPTVQQSAVPAGVIYGQQMMETASNPSENNTPGSDEVRVTPKQSIDIGQIGGVLPPDMSGAFGLVFGMSAREVDQIMSPKAAQAQRNTGYNVYAIPYESSVYMVECRFIDQKLLQIIVGYVSAYSNISKLKLDKKEVPFPEFTRMLNDLTAIYGEPDSTEKIFLSGYSEDDGRILEALKRKKALIYYNWTDEKTGNNIIMGLAYTTVPLAATIYTSGPMSAEAAARKLRLHAYDYSKTFTDNYFSN